MYIYVNKINIYTSLWFAVGKQPLDSNVEIRATAVGKLQSVKRISIISYDFAWRIGVFRQRWKHYAKSPNVAMEEFLNTISFNCKFYLFFTLLYSFLST